MLWGWQASAKSLVFEQRLGAQFVVKKIKNTLALTQLFRHMTSHKACYPRTARQQMFQTVVIWTTKTTLMDVCYFRLLPGTPRYKKGATWYFSYLCNFFKLSVTPETGNYQDSPKNNRKKQTFGNLLMLCKGTWTDLFHQETVWSLVNCFIC